MTSNSQPAVKLGPAQIALAAAAGTPHLDVYVRPRVAILTTGDELVPSRTRPRARPDSQLQCTDAGGAWSAKPAAILWFCPPPPTPPKRSTPRFAQARACRHAPYYRRGLRRQIRSGRARTRPRGRKLSLHRRSHPARQTTGLWEITRTRRGRSAKPFFGLPGNPISSAVTFLLFAAPILAALARRRETRPRFVARPALPRHRPQSQTGTHAFFARLCAFNSIRQRRLPQVALVPWHGSGDLTAFARSNCFLVIPEDAGFLEAGAPSTFCYIEEARMPKAAQPQTLAL